jgi:hypothetical protein
MLLPSGSLVVSIAILRIVHGNTHGCLMPGATCCMTRHVRHDVSSILVSLSWNWLVTFAFIFDPAVSTERYEQLFSTLFWRARDDPSILAGARFPAMASSLRDGSTNGTSHTTRLRDGASDNQVNWDKSITDPLPAWEAKNTPAGDRESPLTF